MRSRNKSALTWVLQCAPARFNVRDYHVVREKWHTSFQTHLACVLSEARAFDNTVLHWRYLLYSLSADPNTTNRLEFKTKRFAELTVINFIYFYCDLEISEMDKREPLTFAEQLFAKSVRVLSRLQSRNRHRPKTYSIANSVHSKYNMKKEGVLFLRCSIPTFYYLLMYLG